VTEKNAVFTQHDRIAEALVFC